MAASPWHLPGSPLHWSVARAIVSVLFFTLVLTLVVAARTTSGIDYAVRCVGALAVAAMLVARHVAPHHPFPDFGAANYVTLVRVALVAAVAGFIGETPTAAMAWLIVGTVVLVGVLDGVDGWLARRSRLSSAFGARFDMETDAALILILSLLVWQHDKAGVWVLACGLMRYAFVAAGWLLPWMAAPLRSTMRGKTVAIAQMIGLGIAISPLAPVPYSGVVAALTLAALAWSFAVDIVWLWRRHVPSRAG